MLACIGPIMIAPTTEQVIRAAALATRDYWRLIESAADNPRYKLELFDRRIQIDAELRGERRPHLTPAIDLNLSVHQDTDRRLEAMRPRIEIEIILERARKRIGYGCGPAQLALSYIAQVRRQLRKLLKDTGLEARELAAAIGVTPTTVQRWLHGGTIPHERQMWLRALEEIRIDSRGRVHLITGPIR